MVALASILLARRVAVIANAPKCPSPAFAQSLPETAHRTVEATGIGVRDVLGGTDGPQGTPQASDVL